MGDGAATLCAVLLAASDADGDSFERGWKQRNSIKKAIENAGTPMLTFCQTEQTLLSALQNLGFEAQRRRIEGEDHLLLVHGTSEVGVASFGIRNSGTQAKTSLSVRLSRNVPNEAFINLLSDVQASLTAVLTDD